MKRIQMCFLLGLLLITLSSCKTWFAKDDEDDKNPFKGMSAEQLHKDAQNALNKKEYLSAIKRYEAMETMYPFSDYTERSQMNLIYAYYKNEDYPAAAAAADRFIQLYPRAKNVDYAYYLRGLANFHQIRTALTKVLPMDESYRDPGTQTQAYSDFALLIQKFPESKYRANALQRMIYLRNMFAKSELNVAQYYFKRKRYVAAIERASYLVKNYPQAPTVKDALIIMYKSNQALGFHEAAAEAKKVYEATYSQPL